MKLHPLASAILASSVLTAGLAGTSVFADDGERLVRSVSSPPGETANPEPEGEHAFIKMMNFHVPSQRADGTVEPIEYYNIDGVLVKTEEKAKPLINAYVYGPVIGFDDRAQSGFPGHGRRDAFGAVSLDDGETWKVTNLSNSADLSSFEVSTPLQDPGVPLDGGTSIVVDDPAGASITTASWSDTGAFGTLTVAGEDGSRDRVTIRNAVTQEELFVLRSDRTGDFDAFRTLEAAPCYVQAGVDGVFGPETEVENAGADCVGPDGGPTLITDYPGDNTYVFHAVAGNKVIAAWQSKYCLAGFPGYTGGSSADADTVAGYLEIDRLLDLYLEDLFVVAGDQGSVNYIEQEEFPGEYAGVGEVPYSCLWAARGLVREDPDAPDTSELVWFQAERLTSGRRDVNRVETSCVAGAGCAITWQEDPDGLAPGEGEGPGTGWAGSVVNSQTDIWYSFVEWEDFDVIDNNGAIEPLADTSLDALGTGRPQPYVPMMVPVRLTNNARCQTNAEIGYCASDVAVAYSLNDQCIDTVQIQQGPSGNPQDICVVDANGSGTLDTGDLPNVANTGASRPRLSLQPRDSDGDGVTDDAWIVLILEESKGLGRFPFLNDEEWTGTVDDTGTACDDETLDNCEIDLGKNTWYVSFAMGTPQTSASEDDYGMLDNLVYQQNQMNAPEVNWITGTFFPPMDTVDMWDFGDTLNYQIFNTEIARRSAMMSQSLAKATSGTSNLVAMPLFKEGVLRQGGPADIMARRIVAPEGVNEADENPYDFTNLACEWYDGEGGVFAGTWLYEDGLNPNYPKGLCTAPTINLSGRTPFECEATGDSDGVCPGATGSDENMVCVDDEAFGQLCKNDSTIDPEDQTTLDQLVSWYECPGSNPNQIGGTGAVAPDCYTEDVSQLLEANLDDRSWYNPIDISKAHRGFLDGDFVAMIYAWSPNYKLNAVGNDRYELYSRRSFTGGTTWTTTPGSFTATDGVTYSGAGTTTCETWRDGDTSATDSHVCTIYDAGAPEQSRNVTQHKSMLITTLDPRYTPTLASMPTECPDWYQLDGVCESDWLLFEPIDETTTLDGDPTDVRNASRWFIVVETGDNTQVAEGEAGGLNLLYGRAEMFGDHFTVWAETDTDSADLSVCYPNDAHGTTDVDWAVGTGFCNEFDTIEGFPLSASEEASIVSSAYGDFLYTVWAQFNLDEEGEFVDGDAMFRRVWYLDDYISDTNAWLLPGLDGGDTTPEPDPGTVEAAASSTSASASSAAAPSAAGGALAPAGLLALLLIGVFRRKWLQ